MRRTQSAERVSWRLTGYEKLRRETRKGVLSLTFRVLTAGIPAGTGVEPASKKPMALDSFGSASWVQVAVTEAVTRLVNTWSSVQQGRSVRATEARP